MNTRLRPLFFCKKIGRKMARESIPPLRDNCRPFLSAMPQDPKAPAGPAPPKRLRVVSPPPRTSAPSEPLTMRGFRWERGWVGSGHPHFPIS